MIGERLGRNVGEGERIATITVKLGNDACQVDILLHRMYGIHIWLCNGVNLAQRNCLRSLNLKGFDQYPGRQQALHPGIDFLPRIQLD